MKKSLLISASLLTLSVVTGIYAQSVGATGGSIIEKMKATAHSFTLGSLLNPTDTSLTSDPVKGKKTGDILTAGEYNRILELLSEGGGGGTGAVWENVPLEGADNFDKTCEYRFYMNAMGLDAIYYVNAVAPTTLIYISHNSVVSSIPSNNKTSYQVNGSPYHTVSKIEKLCGGGFSSSSGSTQIVDGGIIKTSPKTISNWDLITLEGSWNAGSDAAPTGGYIYKLGGQAKLAYVEASGISKDIVLTTTAQNVHNLTVKLSGNDVVIDPSSTNTLAYVVWKLGGGSGSSASSNWTDISLEGTSDFDVSCEYRAFVPKSNSYNPEDRYMYFIGVTPKQLQSAPSNDSQVYIPNNDKKAFYITPYGRADAWGLLVTKIQKRCN